ncbi:ATP-binding protein [Burkholderia gladioli]|uniref:ATP-binding protein n=1 Tax=Burkholderia gladioli TaxID=28095 RepID=UPI001C256C8F|nr:ATP-binding protein [Burkholderia gladioli]
MRLPFELDPAIIHHIIHSQAGSIGKAMIELIMNSVDADARSVVLSMSKDGFTCKDDGRGFASREDVLRYFGRFGTPHQEGDATYGRFRLGRGQIMAHASTVWRSNFWQMTVDTRSMGYSYDLDDLPDTTGVQGCDISGKWYEPLSDTELLSATQEIRDLVRYTPVSVELNGRTISRDPRSEKWDHEDEFAWYRVKVEGAVSIYNQGVLVRHDSSHQWGAGGLIVSKRAISLNVSRTEILRKTCNVWQPIAKQFGAMAREISAQLGEHRKTEASREKAAHDLLAGTENLLQVFASGEVITLLPGKRHLSLFGFLELNGRMHGGRASVAENAFDIPKGEAIAREKIAQIIHPVTLARFSCPTTEDFRDALERIMPIVRERWAALTREERYPLHVWNIDGLAVPDFIDFTTLREAFVERTTIVLEKDALDRETRRMWTALRWCLQQYAGLCAGGRKTRNRGAHYLSGDEHRRHILLGESNAMEAWTDGESYIAYNANIVRRLRQDPIKTAGYLFSLTEHEVAHQGDSIDCGHDEAFYQRYHDISIAMAAERQRYMHLFMQKYVYSMEGEGNRDRSKLWYEQRLIERANNGRQKRELPPAIEDMTSLPYFADTAAAEDMDLVLSINARLVESGALPPPPDWDVVRRNAREAQWRISEARREARAEEARHDAAIAASELALEADELVRVAALLGVDAAAIDSEAWEYLYEGIRWGITDDYIRELWDAKPWAGKVDEDSIFYEQAEQYQQREVERIAKIVGMLETEISGAAYRRLWEEEEGEIRRLWAEKPWEKDTDDVGLETEEEGVVRSNAPPVRPKDDPRNRLAEKYHSLIAAGETWWSVERNAAAAGFHRVEDYLSWRSESMEADAGEASAAGDSR